MGKTRTRKEQAARPQANRSRVGPCLHPTILLGPLRQPPKAPLLLSAPYCEAGMSFQPGKPPSPAPPSLLPLTLTAASALPSHTLLPGTVGGVREQCPGVTRLQSPETHSQSGRQEVAAGLEGTGRPQALLPDDSTPSLGGPDSGRSPLCEGGTRGRTRRTRQVRTVTLGQAAGGTQLRLSCDPWDQRRGEELGEKVGATAPGAAWPVTGLWPSLLPPRRACLAPWWPGCPSLYTRPRTPSVPD